MTVFEASPFQPTVVFFSPPPTPQEQLLYSNLPQPKYNLFLIQLEGHTQFFIPVLLYKSVHFTPVRIWNYEVC